MSTEVELVSDDTIVPIRNIVNCETGYILTSSGHSRRLMPGVVMKVTAGELRELFYQPGGSILLQNYIHVGNENLAKEFGVSEDMIEYNWTAEDIKNALTADPIEVLLDALDFAPQGVIEAIKDDAVELEINDKAKISAISEKTGVDIDALIKNKHAYDNEDTTATEKPKQRRTNSSTTTRKRRATTTKKTAAKKTSTTKTESEDTESAE